MSTVGGEIASNGDKMAVAVFGFRCELSGDGEPGDLLSSAAGKGVAGGMEVSSGDECVVDEKDPFARYVGSCDRVRVGLDASSTDFTSARSESRQVKYTQAFAPEGGQLIERCCTLPPRRRDDDDEIPRVSLCPEMVEADSGECLPGSRGGGGAVRLVGVHRVSDRARLRVVRSESKVLNRVLHVAAGDRTGGAPGDRCGLPVPAGADDGARREHGHGSYAMHR